MPETSLDANSSNYSMAGPYTIQDLPNEALIDVFEYLETEDKKNITRVCRRFRNVLINKKSFIKSLTLDIEHETKPRSALEFSYSKINIARTTKHVRKRTMRILKDHRATITSILFDIGHSAFMTKSLSIMSENLTTLEVRSFDDSRHPCHVVVIDLPNLKKLTTVLSPAIYKYIGKHKIHEMSLNEYQTAPEINKFLETCVDLKKMLVESFVPTYDPTRHSYQLEHLHIELDDFNSDRQVTELLKHHQESLKILKLHYANESAKFAISKMKLEEFTCSQLGFGSERINLMPNYTIKKLTVNSNDDDVASYHLILTACKNVERLIILNHGPFGGSVIALISGSMRNLKSLSIPNYTSLKAINTMACLETLEVREVRTKDEHRSWIKLATSCPNLKRVRIIQRPKLTDLAFSIPMKNLKKLLKTCEKLSEFCIGPHFKWTDEFKDVLLSYGKTRNLLVLIESVNYDEDADEVRKIDCSTVRFEVIKSTMDHFYEYRGE